MKLDKHIAYRFLNDDDMPHEICEHMYPGLYKYMKEKVLSNQIADYDKHRDFNAYMSLYNMVRVADQRAYVITDTVVDVLDLLKVNKTAKYELTGKGTNDTVSTIDTYDWSVFDSLREQKITLILPNNALLRVHRTDKFLSFIHLTLDWKKHEGHIDYTASFIDFNFKRLSANWIDKEMQGIELYVYRLLCFMYLTENTEEIVQPGHKYGTRKSGKVVNQMKIPVTVVTSKWNVTSIRTEGFDVSGHFRLQPTINGPKIIFIQPFRKHGYVRRAKKEDNI